MYKRTLKVGKNLKTSQKIERRESGSDASSALLYGHTYSKGMDQPGKVANPAISLSTFTPENLVSRDGFGSPVPCQPAHIHTQDESGAYLRDFSRVRGVHTYIFKTAIRYRVSPEFIGARNCVPMTFTARVRRHMSSKPQGSSE